MVTKEKRIEVEQWSRDHRRKQADEHLQVEINRVKGEIEILAAYLRRLENVNDSDDIKTLGLSTRTTNLLYRAEIDYIPILSKLYQTGEIKNLKGLGTGMLDELHEALLKVEAANPLPFDDPAPDLPDQEDVS